MLSTLLALCLAQTPQPAVLSLQDGSTLRAAVLTPSLEVETPYGTLKIPAADIRRIRFGAHLAPDEAKALPELLKEISDTDYHARQGSQNALARASARLFPHLARESGKGDLERQKRLQAVLQALRDSHPENRLKTPFDDSVETPTFTAVGRIRSASLEVQTEAFGRTELPLYTLASLSALAGDTKLDVPADDGWHDTGIDVGDGLRLAITAQGTVDLWPQVPGQHVAISPKGFNTTGKGGLFLAGALIGRVGEGKAFFIGERYDGVPEGRGKLFLQVVPSPWNAPSAGSYEVRISPSLR